MSDIIKGTVFANGQSVDATALNNLVDLAVVQPDLINSRGAETSPSTADTILVYQAGPPAILKKVALNNLPGLTSLQSADNTGMGQGSFGSLSTGTGNAAFGKNALALQTEGSNSTAIGHEAGYGSQGPLAVAAEDNTDVGYRAGYSNVNGDWNVMVGKSAGENCLHPQRCTVVGKGAMEDAGSIISDNTAIGHEALKNVTYTGGTEGSDNTAVGSGALKANTTAKDNTAVGTAALAANTTGEANTAMGLSALAGSVDGSNNTAVGYQAGLNQLASSEANTYLGAGAGRDSNNGDENVMVGASAGQESIYNQRCTAVGFEAMKDTGTLMSDNTAVGYQALKNATYVSGTDGANNTAIGGAALITNTTGSQNVAVGVSALSQQTDPQGNVGIGYQAAYTGTTGEKLTSVGYRAGFSNVTSDHNTNVGYWAGFYKTAAGCTAVGASADINVGGAALANTTALGYLATSLYANETVFAPSDTVLRPGSDGLCDLGRANYKWKDVYASNGTIITSDRDTKKNIKDSDLGLDFINQLQPRKYQLRDQKATKHTLDLPEGGTVDIGQKAQKFQRTHYGLIAQEVKEVLGETDFAGYVDTSINSEEGNGLALRYTEFISPLIAAVKELSAKVAVLESNG